MKLIDADEFAIEEPKMWDWSSIEGISSTAVLKQCIWDVQCAPTVKAIPVEWIEKQIEKALSVDSVDLFYVGSLKHLIKEWEKENETH